MIFLPVTIKFYSGFEKYLQSNSNKVLNLNINSREDIRSILLQFLPEDALGFVGMVLVNKKITDFDYKVIEGDAIEVFPVIGGG